jgi:adenylosuccinate lyase
MLRTVRRSRRRRRGDHAGRQSSGRRSIQPQSIFHYPDQDRDYFASMYRTFHHDRDDIRITLHHSTELQLVASRRIAYRLKDAGRTPAEAHELVSRAAKIAWPTPTAMARVPLAGTSWIPGRER